MLRNAPSKVLAVGFIVLLSPLFTSVPAIAAETPSWGQLYPKLFFMREADRSETDLNTLLTEARKFPPSDARLALTLEFLRGHFERQQDHARELSLANQLLELSCKVHGEQNIRAALLCERIGQCHSRLGEFDKASEAYDRALTMLEQIPGVDPLTVASLNASRGYVYLLRGRCAESVQFYDRAIPILRYHLADRHAYYCCLKNYSFALEGAGRREQATACLREMASRRFSTN